MCSYVESLQDIIQQLCSLSQEFAGCHPTTIGVDDYQNFGSNLYVYRGTSFFVSYLVRMLLCSCKEAKLKFFSLHT